MENLKRGRAEDVIDLTFSDEEDLNQLIKPRQLPKAFSLNQRICIGRIVTSVTDVNMKVYHDLVEKNADDYGNCKMKLVIIPKINHVLEYTVCYAPPPIPNAKPVNPIKLGSIVKGTAKVLARFATELMTLSTIPTVSFTAEELKYRDQKTNSFPLNITIIITYKLASTFANILLSAQNALGNYSFTSPDPRYPLGEYRYIRLDNFLNMQQIQQQSLGNQQMGVNPVGSAAYNMQHQPQQRANDEELMKSQIDAIYDSLTDSVDLPEVEPDSRLLTKLYKHQKQALYFMLERERNLTDIPKVVNNDKKTPMTAETMTLWRRDRKGQIKNLITNQIWNSGTDENGNPVPKNKRSKPQLSRGGILADDMGLGKTIEAISLILHPGLKEKLPEVFDLTADALNNIDDDEDDVVLLDESDEELSRPTTGTRNSSQQMNDDAISEDPRDALLDDFFKGLESQRSTLPTQTLIISSSTNQNTASLVPPTQNFNCLNLPTNQTTPLPVKSNHPAIFGLELPPPISKPGTAPQPQATSNVKMDMFLANNKAAPNYYANKPAPFVYKSVAGVLKAPPMYHKPVSSSVEDNKTSVFNVQSSAVTNKSVKHHTLRDNRQFVKTNSTLIVCPLSTVSNWEEQITAHVKRGTFNVHVYHGNQRSILANHLAKFDVVLTTYNILSLEYTRELKSYASGEVNESVLHSLHWYRVILDEAHIIKDSNTGQSKSACCLAADIRWCLTGTPIQNKLDDLFSLVKFLRLDPFSSKPVWNQHFSKLQTARDKDVAVSQLQTLMRSITLRRTKESETAGALFQLPTKTEHLVNVDLDETELSIYRRIEAKARKLIENGNENTNSTMASSYVHLLELSLRLRQACVHPALCKNIEEELEDLNDFPKLTQKRVSHLYNLLKETGADQCSVCGKVRPDESESIPDSTIDKAPVITKCGHILCFDCCTELFSQSNYIKCPNCQTSLVSAECCQLIKGKYDDYDDDEDEDIFDKSSIVRNVSSTKIGRLVDDLESVRRYETENEQKPIKSIVFSQWTKVLDLIETPLNERGFKYARLDGKMNRVQRNFALDKFKKDATAGGVGLNLTHASRVYIMEPYWNPAVEQQAVDRVHRLGQTLPVIVIRFIAQGMIEERMVTIQERKKRLVSMTFKEEKKKGKRRSVDTREVKRRVMINKMKWLLFGDDEGLGGFDDSDDSD